MQELERISCFVNALKRKSVIDIIEKIIELNNPTVTDIYVALRLSQSYCSQILRVLKALGLADTNKVGKFTTYSIDEIMYKKYMLLIDSTATQLEQFNYSHEELRSSLQNKKLTSDY